MYSWLPDKTFDRMVYAYGSNLEKVIGDANGPSDLGHNYGQGNHALYEKEVEYLVEQEFAKNAEDVLFRRSKMHLHVPEPEQQTLENYMSGLVYA